MRALPDSSVFQQLLDLHKTGRFAEAAERCVQLLENDPDNPSLLNLQGDALQSLGRLEEALASYRGAMQSDPGFFPAWYSAGCASISKREYAIAADYLRTALDLAPEHAESHHNLGSALFQLGLVDEAIASFRRALALQAGFVTRTTLATVIPGAPGATNREVLADRRTWAETHLPPPAPRAMARVRTNGGKLRIGYLSSFFQSRNWMKPVWGVIRNHDRASFEIHLFSDCAESECAGAFDRHHTDRFHDISSLSNKDAARLIEEAGIDVLVDLNGYSRVPRLAVLALRPAPVIVGWFNYYATSGLTTVDYIVGDGSVVPPEEEPFYSERVIRVPNCYLSFDVRYPVPDVVEPPVRKRGRMTFGCLASQYKLTPHVIAAWARVLQRCPGCRLFLKNANLGSDANRASLLRRFQDQGVQPDRIEFEGPSEHFDFLAAYGRVDLALDPFPYNGGTTTSEALWQGVPVLTFHGDRWAGRQSSSLLRAAGLTEFVAADVDGYVELAVSVAGDPQAAERLGELRRTMRERLLASPLCDTAGLARSLESLYARIATE